MQPGSPPYELSRWIRTEPALALAVACVIATVICTIAFATS